MRENRVAPRPMERVGLGGDIWRDVGTNTSRGADESPRGSVQSHPALTHWSNSRAGSIAGRPVQAHLTPHPRNRTRNLMSDTTKPENVIVVGAMALLFAASSAQFA